MRIRRRIYSTMVKARDEDITKALSKLRPTRLLDIGCADGNKTTIWMEASQAKEGIGVEIDLANASEFKKKGMEVIVADLNRGLPFRDSQFDLIISNQVIEHIFDLDCFASEAMRVGMNNSTAVISTENLSSWENIFALLVGLRPFSLTYSKKHFGNKFSLVEGQDEHGSHLRVLTYYSFKDLLKLSGMQVCSIIGSGIFFFPWLPLSKLASRIDPIHCRFITIVGAIKKSP